MVIQEEKRYVAPSQAPVSIDYEVRTEEVQSTHSKVPTHIDRENQHEQSIPQNVPQVQNTQNHQQGAPVIETKHQPEQIAEPNSQVPPQIRLATPPYQPVKPVTPPHQH